MYRTDSENIRFPSVAGQFYPDDSEVLHQQVAKLISEAPEIMSNVPKILIAPHAGYIYSGPVAASAYKTLINGAEQISRVVLLSPAHRFGFQGIAYSSADFFRTPLGDLKVDYESIISVSHLPFVKQLEQAFDGEHALEVHLPFLQEVLGYFEIVPFIVGQANAEDVAELLALLWGDTETLIVISSDLSHFHSYEQAVSQDQNTSELITSCKLEQLTGENACGVYPLRGALLMARNRDMRISALDIRNSGDTAGNRDRVVGYGAYAIF